MRLGLWVFLARSLLAYYVCIVWLKCSWKKYKSDLVKSRGQASPTLPHQTVHTVFGKRGHGVIAIGWSLSVKRGQRVASLKNVTEEKGTV